MNSVRSKVIENYRTTYDPVKRLFELRKAWPDVEGDSDTVLYSITEKVLIATFLDLSREGV